MKAFLIFLCFISLAWACSKKVPLLPVVTPPDTSQTSVHPPPDTPVTQPVLPDTTIEYSIKPVQTDPQINVALEAHFVCLKPNSPLRKNTLFIFLPGSYAQPAQYKGIVRKAAALGYHAIGLMYPDDKPVNNFCAGTNDTTCHRRARLEILDGVDRSPNVDVNKTNSVINRVQKLLAFLQQQHPAENWGQFLQGDSVKWNMVVMGGHSQGGGNAAVMGRYYPLKRVVMFSMMDWMNNGKVPDWVSMTANKGNYYDIYNTLDEDVPYGGAKLGWERMGMTTTSGPAVNADGMHAPYNNARVLLTAHQPANATGPKFHNSTAMDAYIQKDTSGKYVLDEQWGYLLGE